ncbi:hypothetical protein BH23ACT10_BH23ACT10_16680 [soil metagenome]
MPPTPTSSEPSCGDAERFTLQVSAAPEVAPAIREIIELGRSDAGGLRCVDVALTATPAATVRSALARGWTESTDGPAPHVWIPTTSTEHELGARGDRRTAPE